MKKQIAFFLLLFAAFAASAQTLYTNKRDSIPAAGSSFTLQAGSYRGNIQWQSSTDCKTWTDLPGATKSQLDIPATTEAFYRAKITDGDCFVTYSDSAVVLLPKTQNLTTDPKAVPGATYSSSDGSNFVYRTSGKLPLKQGDILLDPNSTDGIRIVSGIKSNGDSIIVETTVGTMADLFVNQSFNLTTEASSAVKSIQGLSNAIAGGYIHPTGVIDHNAASGGSLKSVAAGVPLVNFGQDFSGETIYQDDNLLLQFKEGYYNFKSALKCDIAFEQLKFDLAHLRISGGNLKRFSFYTDPDVTGVEAKLVLLAQAKGKVSVEKEYTIKPKVLDKSFKFLVGNVPVWMDVTIDLMGKVSGEISSSLMVTGGASASVKTKQGATYENRSWTRINESTTSLTLEGPDVNGKVNQELQVEIYPHIEVKFYKTLGPNLDIAPYLREEMNYSTTGNYDFGLFTGVNARLGIKMESFGEKLFDFQTDNINLVEKELYKAPKKLKVLSGNNQYGEAGKALTNPIVFQVMDSKDSTAANYRLSIKKKGAKSSNLNLKIGKSTLQNLDEEAILTDSDGKASYEWIIDRNVEGEQQFEVYLRDGKDQIITSTDTMVKANVCDCEKRFSTFTDPRDGRVYKTITIGTQTWMAENLDYLPVPASDPTIGSEDNGNEGKPFYYVYDRTKYGVLYNWYAALTAAPPGWHLPTDEEWTTLSNYLGGDAVAGGKMKPTTGWNSPNTGATNNSCFSALPGGTRYANGFDGAGYNGFWWSSSPSDYNNGWYRGLYCYYSNLYRYDDYLSKCNAFSVCCVKN